jgi:hypothetical protein
MQYAIGEFESTFAIAAIHFRIALGGARTLISRLVSQYSLRLAILLCCSLIDVRSVD